MNQDDTFDKFLEEIKDQMLIFGQKDLEIAVDGEEDEENFEEYVVSVLETAMTEFEDEFFSLLDQYEINKKFSRMAEELYQGFYRKEKHYAKILPEFSVIEMFIEGKRVVVPVPKLETVIKKYFGLKLSDKGYYLVLFYLSTTEFYERLIFFDVFKSSFSQDV